MTKKNLWMPAILCCTLTMTSCLGDTVGEEDNPVTPAESETSAVDQGKWWLDESYMDKSVKPGDNFYMYCNGTWWKNTPFPADAKEDIGYDTEITTAFKKQMAALTDANYQIFKNHLKWADDGSATALAALELYKGVLAQSGLDKAETADDVLRAFGKMVEMGVAPGFWLEPFFYKGKLCFYLKNSSEIFVEPADSDGDHSQSRGLSSLRQMVRQYPQLLSHLVPLSGRSATRAIQQKWSAIRGIVEGMGINPESVYLLEDHAALMPPISSEALKRYVDEEHAYYTLWQKPYETGDVKALKKRAMSYLSNDSAFISKGAMEKISAGLNFTDNGKPVKIQISLKSLEQTFEQEYLAYLRSKMVADQLVPAGQKETLLQYCKELKAVFAQRIKANDWLSDGSKQNALEKLDAMEVNVGYPDKWYAEGLPDFSKSQSLLEDIYITRRARLNLLKAITGKDRKETFTVSAMSQSVNLTVVNAVYDPNSNSINILPYYVLPPLFDPAQSLAFNYAILCVSGHEMTHGFDTLGSMFDKNGDYKPEGIWASAADKTEFNRRAKLLVKCYASYDLLPDELPGQKANGEFTLGENIADLGGMEIVWQAYLNRLKADGYTGDQLKLMKQRFFRAHAELYRSKYDAKYAMSQAFGENDGGPNEHSLPKERVNGVVANMDGWYDAFDIKDGALYRKPADRIHIW